MILLNVKQRFNMENIQYFYSRIFESDFLLYLSAFLLSCSVICLFCVLRNVSISYPDFVDEKEFIEKSKSDDAFSPSALPVFQYERSIRQDLRSLPSKKVCYTLCFYITLNIIKFVFSRVNFEKHVTLCSILNL